ncbi:hypothetical protein [Sutcliffiella horikoshii]|nr:hypothetical protein [Sutcliffiella horikoshii]
MGRYDHHTWREIDDFSCISELEFSEEVIVNFVKSILELNEDDEEIKEK